jgi:hypothetical protein
MAGQLPGLAKRQAEVLPTYHGLWRDLVFAVPFKNGNWMEVSQGIVIPFNLQNVGHVAGLFGSSMYRPVNVKAFAFYPGGVGVRSQYTFTRLDQWTLAWAAHPLGSAPGITHYWLLSSLLNSAAPWYGSWQVYHPFLSNNINMRLWFPTGWQIMGWNAASQIGGAKLRAGTHTFTIRKLPGVRTCEMHVDGISLGTQSYSTDVGYSPFFNMSMTVGAYDHKVAAIPGSWEARWDAVCAWGRYLDDSELQQWHANPLAMFTPARRRVPTPSAAAVAPGPPERPCDWFDSRTGLPWHDAGAGQDWQDVRPGSGWYDEAAAQGWLQEKAGQSWLQAEAGQDWLDAVAGQSWLRSRAGQAWLQSVAGRAWSAGAGGGDWYDDEADSGWYDERECS